MALNDLWVIGSDFVQDVYYMYAGMKTEAQAS